MKPGHREIFRRINLPEFRINMDKKYFFFDIDGTLTDLNTKKIIPSAQEAVNKLQDAGHFVSICTSPPLEKSSSVAFLMQAL